MQTLIILMDTIALIVMTAIKKNLIIIVKDAVTIMTKMNRVGDKNSWLFKK